MTRAPGGIATLARIGGLTRAAQYDGLEVTSAARAAFTGSFLTGHGCKVCPRIDVPIDLPLPERERRAEALRRLHYQRVSLAASGARAAKRARALVTTPEAA